MARYLSVCLIAFACAADPSPLEGTAPLTATGDLPMQMVDGIGVYLDRAITDGVAARAARWNRDFSSPEAYATSIAPNRARFLSIIGAIDTRDEPNMIGYASPDAFPGAGDGRARAMQVRWSVFRSVEGEGVLIEPVGPVRAQVVLMPDCDVAPEAFLGQQDAANFGRWLAARGCRVLVPVLIDRSDEFSGTPGLRMTNQPHREFVYRTGYELGRHIIGYEVQKVLAAVDWLASRRADAPIAVAGHGEGGLIAFYAAACDPRIDAALVSGYFQPRERVWAEPIYRNVWALLHEFGDAEIASLIAPRTLIVEAAAHPDVDGPPAPRGERSGAAPGAIRTPPHDAVARETQRANDLIAPLRAPVQLITPASPATPFCHEARAALARALQLDAVAAHDEPAFVLPPLDSRARMRRQVAQLVDDTQFLMHQASFRRKEFWSNADASSPEAWAKTVEPYRTYFSEESIGALPPIQLPPNARTRQVYDTPGFIGYEVVLDVYPDVFAYGILLVPKGIARGERRPVVVCQHGLEGRVQEVADPSVNSPYYHQFACKLAERGFIAYAPQNPYIGEDRFRVLQRKANPMKLALFSFIVRQHEQTLNWLGSLPFVDADRVAFYGLSYGGKTAMRVPALLDGYCLSICSGDYNEWIWKCASVHHPLSYVFTGEDEMWEWDLGNRFNHAEMSWLIFPRPFMVERGHHDGVGYDEWVAYEFAKTKRHYVLLGRGDDARIEYFNGPHTIHGVGTFEFLHQKLRWPKP